MDKEPTSISPEFKRRYEALPLTAQQIVRLDRMSAMPQYSPTRRETFARTALEFERGGMKDYDRKMLDEFRRWAAMNREAPEPKKP